MCSCGKRLERIWQVREWRSHGKKKLDSAKQTATHRQTPGGEWLGGWVVGRWGSGAVGQWGSGLGGEAVVQACFKPRAWCGAGGGGPVCPSPNRPAFFAVALKMSLCETHHASMRFANWAGGGCPPCAVFADFFLTLCPRWRKTAALHATDRTAYCNRLQEIARDCHVA